ncbi:hypothetical protein [Sphingobium sp. CAP-1]|uniref:hypothetical protein n=1 Tax=Sphingobium sp. CAP-1 TaxID=2676077 RepID=UPI0012BB384F|nr:hypothetical protein [Sphingobium sp. CAP-1]QGP81256.1 hypothetical protein GL174_19680 [Sphingobium sp. CAP-1]
MRFFLIATATALTVASVPALAQTAPAPAPATAPAKVKYTTADTDLGTLLDIPAAKAIIEKHIPGMTTNDQVDMARGMTLKAIQQYAPDDVTDARLVAIDAELAKLP